jgi:hypothetical protein
MIELYKIATGKYDKTAGNFIKMWNDNTTRPGNRGHSYKIYIQRAKLDLRKNSFSIRTTQIWNNLPEYVVAAKTMNTFKNRLDQHWSNQELLYDDHRSEINISEEDPEGTCTRIQH